MKILDVIACILLIIGGLNWGLVGLFNFNLVDFVFGKIHLDRLIYIIVGLCSIYQIIFSKAIRARWCK